MKYLNLSHCVSAALLYSLTVFSGVCEGHGHHHHDHSLEEEEECFHWTQENTANADIQVEVAGPGVIQNRIQVSGKIIPHPTQFAYVSPKVDGSILEIRKGVGDYVKSHEVLAVIESREISEAKADYLSALKKFALQQKVLKQETTLRGISSEQDYLYAELAYEEAKIDVESALQNLYALGFSEQEVEGISKEDPSHRRFYEIKAPIAGKIVQRNLTLGELVEHSTRLFTVGNLEKVGIEIHIAQNDVHYLKEGLPVEILGSEDKRAEVKIDQFTPTICEETRMATALAALENANETWSPGEFVTVYIQTSLFHAPLVVSKEAIQKMKGEHYVFVAGEEGSFTPTLVQIGKTDGKNVEILSGLQEGDVYAARNTFCLKAEYEKEEAEHSH